MRNAKSLILAVSLFGSLIAGGIAAADEGDRRGDRVHVRDHRGDAAQVVVTGGQDHRYAPVFQTPTRRPPVMVRDRVRPRRGMVWISGEYDYSDGRYAYRPGRYETARYGHHWVPARWVRTHHGWVKMDGRWDRR